MTELTPQPLNPDRYKTLVVILTVITTVITAVVAGLNADASIRASLSNRDSQQYAILAEGELQRVSLQSAYDMKIFTGFLLDAQTSTIMSLTANQETNAQVVADSELQSILAQARADAAQKFSIFFTDPRYVTKTQGGLPNMQAYLNDFAATAKDLVIKQNAAADNYNRWNRKGDSYTSVLAILAISLFLFGLAQALSPRLRLIFAFFGLSALVSAGLSAVLIVVG
jgi:hypothetical protein